jgi:hypothetical protein
VKSLPSVGPTFIHQRQNRGNLMFDQPEQVPVHEPEAVQPETTAAAVPNQHAEAGRKGAQRVHQLIQQGRLYEQEHGLKRGRQRLRQLLEEGKLYEQEHGVRPRRKRTVRQSREELLAGLLYSLVRLVKPRYRAELLEVLRALEGRKQEAKKDQENSMSDQPVDS